jgi:hypothetical protein
MIIIYKKPIWIKWESKRFPKLIYKKYLEKGEDPQVEEKNLGDKVLTLIIILTHPFLMQENDRLQINNVLFEIERNLINFLLFQ